MAEKSIKKNAVYSSLKAFLTLVFPLITFPYASRILLPEGIGRVNFANSVVSYFILIASLGIGGYATREAAKLKHDKIALTKFFKEILFINLVCSIIAYILFLIALFFVPKFSEYRNLLLVCSIKIIISTMGIEWIYIANEEFRYITVRSFIFQFIGLGYLFTFIKTPDDILHYAIFGMISSVGSNLFNFIHVRKYIDVRQKISFEVKKHLRSIVIFWGMALITSIYTMLDTTMLGFLSSIDQVGFYSASTKLGHMVLGMLTAITTVLLPRLSTYVQRGNMDSFKALSQKSASIILLLSIPMMAGLFILARPSVLLLSGQRYLPAIPVMQVILPIIVIITLGSLVGGQILTAIGKEKISLYSCITGAVVNFTLNIIFIPKFGALGAAISTVVAEFMVTGIQLMYVREYVINRDFVITFIESLFASLVMMISIYFLLRKIDNLVLQITISVIVGIIVYALILFCFKNKIFMEYLNKGITKLYNASIKPHNKRRGIKV